MNEIRRSPVELLGYHFIDPSHLPKGKDEYYLRDSQRQQQNALDISYRQLTAYEIEVLVRNRNTSANWNHLLVSDAFTAELVQDCKFFGLVRIGKLERWYLEFHNLRRPVGLYNSTIISSDLGDNIVVENVNYLSHYIIGNNVMIVNVNELATTETAKFGNGILKEGEPESQRIRLELCNENGGRSVLPFDGMLAGDAWLWSRFRDDALLQEKLRDFTEKKFDNRRGYYGRIGDRTVIKNCKMIKDVLVGSDAYVKGANKLKNLTINSSPEAPSQVGEGCELVNGIIGVGCRIFYGAKAVRFVMASHSQLKYGARLINSYLGDNATISCCEVLNSLIFPAHEQHHNNSFLCASMLMGQTNVAAGATIGSNHNSRGADGELIAGRGFWPGLCVTLKHNSRFAPFTLLTKADYPAELDIPIPFSLVSNDPARDELVIMPGYWFLHNMYALARNAWKYEHRDKRTNPVQRVEWDFLAPDTIGEMVQALGLLEQYVGHAWAKKYEGNVWVSCDNDECCGGKQHADRTDGIQEHVTQMSLEAASDKPPDEHMKNHDNKDDALDVEILRTLGRKLLLGPPGPVEALEIFAAGWENSNRRTRLVKVHEAYQVFRELITYYAAQRIVDTIETHKPASYHVFRRMIPKGSEPGTWCNVGGQLIEEAAIRRLLRDIRDGHVQDWEDVHRFYSDQGSQYPEVALEHALSALRIVHDIDIPAVGWPVLRDLLKDSLVIRQWMTKGIIESREKDHRNPFRRMIYSGQEEMDAVTGVLEENDFIRMEKEAAAEYGLKIAAIVQRFGAVVD